MKQPQPIAARRLPAPGGEPGLPQAHQAGSDRNDVDANGRRQR